MINEDYREYVNRKIKIERQIKSSEDRNTYDEVFDKRTLLAFYYLFNHGILDTLNYSISTGKEANVFIGKKDEKSYAVKVYRTSNANFKAIINYIEGDYRFDKVKKTKDNIIYLWAQKEFKNLEIMHKFHVHVPKPIISYQNILIMQYLGTSKSSAPILKDLKLENPANVFEEVKKSILLIVNRAKLVHSDLSEYNILYYRKLPYIIDVGQSVPLTHPLAIEFLRRDIENIVKYFNKYGLEIKENEIFKELKLGD
jgi:RIO kinase 1